MKKLFFGLLLGAGLTAHAQVVPLLTTNWNQGCYFNDSVPALSGPCGNAYTGCVPTAMAQLMKYHAYPTSGWGTNSYTPACCGPLSLDFSTQTYNYAAMPNSLSSSNAGVAQLMLHCGIAAEAYYSPSNTIAGGSISDMKHYFKYSLEMAGVYKNQMTDTEFENLIISELEAGRVVAAVGGSHQYLIDGYQTSPSLKFHLNFGWGGSYNGYYTIHNVIVASTNYTPVLITHHIQPLVDGFELSDTITASASSQIVSFELSSLTNWTLVGSSPWISGMPVSGTSGYYNDYLSVDANPLYSTRYGTVSYSNGSTTKTMVIKQNGITPSLMVTPLSTSFASGGGTITATISTDSTWTATTASSWITLSSSAGTGNDSIDISATPNGAVARTGYVTIQRGALSQIIEIIQGSSSTFWCVPSMTTAGSDGISDVQFNSISRASAINEGYIVTTDTTDVYLDSTYTIYVTVQGGVAPGVWIDWNVDGDFNDGGEAVVSPSGSWYPSFNTVKTAAITVPSTAQLGITRMRVYAKDFGTGPITNPCNTSDNGGDIEDYHLIIKDSRYLESSVNSLFYDAGSSSQSLTISTDSVWNLTSYPSWITPSVVAGVNGTSVSLTTDEQVTFNQRNGLLTFERGTKLAYVSVQQSGLDSLIQFTQDTIVVTSSGLTGFNLDVTSNFTYQVGSLDSWVLSSTSSASGNASFSIDILENTGTNRTGLVVIGTGTVYDTLVILQDSVSTALSINPDTLYVDAAGSVENFDITTPSTWYLNITDSWLDAGTITSTGNTNVTLTCAANTGGTRQSIVQITTSGAAAQLIVVQAPGDLGTLAIDPAEPKVYPNPFSTSFAIEQQGVIEKWMIYDHYGRFIKNGVGSKASDLDQLQSGNYILYVTSTTGMTSILKIIKL